MKKIIYLCVVISFNFHMVGQRQSEQPPQIDTICYSMEKHLSFTYNNTQIPVTAGWIYNNYYSDEFNGSVLDYNKWMCLDHYYHPNNNVIGYLEENVSVSNGRLVLSAKYDEEPQIYTSFGNNPPTSMNFNPVNGNMPQPDEDFAVEYFRCYKLARGSINTYNPSVFTPSAESRKVYPNIVLGGNGHTALINTSTAVWAEQSIVFDTGFELSSGVSFSARIINHGSENPATSPLYIINNPNECF